MFNQRISLSNTVKQILYDLVLSFLFRPHIAQGKIKTRVNIHSQREFVIFTGYGHS